MSRKKIKLPCGVEVEKLLNDHKITESFGEADIEAAKAYIEKTRYRNLDSIKRKVIDDIITFGEILPDTESLLKEVDTNNKQHE